MLPVKRIKLFDSAWLYIQVVDFVESLEAKSYANAKKKGRTFGYSKDFFKMSDNFDEPLDNFKEYMNAIATRHPPLYLVYQWG